MKRKLILTAISCFILVNLVLGWSNGQNPNTSNPTAQNCSNAGCHGGTPQDSCMGVNVQTLLGGGNWQTGMNAIRIQPFAAVDTNLGTPGGYCGDTTLKCWNYTVNFTSCSNQPIPINVYFHDCMQGLERIYQSNGIYYAELGASAGLGWQAIPGQPANVAYYSNWCILFFNVTNPSFTDSILINVGLVLGNCDSTASNDSTVFYSTKLGYSGQLSNPLPDLTGPYHLHPQDVQVNYDGIKVNTSEAWQIVLPDGKILHEDIGPAYVSLPTGLYYFRKKNGRSKIITIQ